MRNLNLSPGRKHHRAAGLASCAAIALLASGALVRPAYSQTLAANTNESVVVTAEKSSSKVQIDTQPRSEIATSFSLSQTDIKSIVTATTVDLIRTIPGVYGGYVNGGIANGLGLRGWSGSGDGTAVATYVDNYQRNVLSGGNSNGYLELHPLIPETIGSLDLIKGPFSVRFGGPFSFGGSLVINTTDYVPTGISQSFGSFGKSRTLGSLGYESGDLKFYTVLEGLHEDGYRQNAQLDRINWFSKLTLPVGSGILRTTFQVFQNDYGQPMYPPLTDVLRGPKTQAVNPLDKGNKIQFTGTANYTVVLDDYQISINAFTDKSRIYRSASRKSNSNPAASDPALQNITNDGRWVYGGGIDVFRPVTLWDGATGGIRFGGSIEQNAVQQSRYPGFNNLPVPQPTVLNAAVQQVTYWGDFTELATNTYLEGQLKPVEWLKVSAGVRYDNFDYDVRVLSPSGAALPVFNAAGVITTPGRPGTLNNLAYKNNSGRVTGRGGIAVTPIENLTLYANVGEGVNPTHAITDLRSNPNLQSLYMISQEIGLSYDNPDLGLHFGIDGYRTINSGEIVSVGGVNTNVGKSRRLGGDVDASILAYSENGYNLKISAAASGVRARVINTATPFITGVPPYQYSYGLDFDAPVDVLGIGEETARWSLFHSFVGPTKNNASGTVEAPIYDRITTKAAYYAPGWHNLEIYLGGIFYPNSVTSECCAYLTYDGSRAVAITPRISVEGGVAIKF